MKTQKTEPSCNNIAYSTSAFNWSCKLCLPALANQHNTHHSHHKQLAISSLDCYLNYLHTESVTHIAIFITYSSRTPSCVRHYWVHFEIRRVSYRLCLKMAYCIGGCWLNGGDGSVLDTWKELMSHAEARALLTMAHEVQLAECSTYMCGRWNATIGERISRFSLYVLWASTFNY
jgi:hypothetical protein